LTVDTTSTTAYAINGTNYTGSAGLTQLAMSAAGTMILAYGSWDTTTQTFTASSVLAGSSVPGTMHDSLTGIVISRSGDSLTVARGLIERWQLEDMEFSRQTTVSVGSGTTVTEQGQSGSFTIADISVGQQIQASGTFGAAGSGTPTLDATAGSVQLVPTTVSGTVTSTGTNLVTLDLQYIDRFAASNFNFAGTGTTTAQDATASAYTVAVPPALTSAGALTANTPAQFTGFVAPFGAAPPDFNALSLTNYANTTAQLQLGWLSGYAMPFSTLSSTELLISQTALQASNWHVIRIGFETIDPSTLTSGLQLVPDTTAANQFFIIAHRSSWMLDSYSTFADFVTALTSDLTGTTEVEQLSARGPYAAGVLSAYAIEVLLSD